MVISRKFGIWVAGCGLLFIMSFFVPDKEVDFCYGERIKGISLVAPPQPFLEHPMTSIKAVNANWIAVIPYGFSRKGEPSVRYTGHNQWWGETTEGLIATIKKAHESHVSVMLKPQVYIPRGWVGEMDFVTEAEWLIWEEDYDRFIMHFVDMAVTHDVEMICIGTEYRISAVKREAFWRGLIKKIRKAYSGHLVYSGNWDSYDKVPFWDDLDFIGLSAYFPLVDTQTPSRKELLKAWAPITKKLRKFSQKYKKPMLFTEYGYLSVDQCAYQNWELEKIVKQLPINQTAQSNAYAALLENFWGEDFWAGGFIWKWFPDGRGHEGYIERDYTPQNKIAEVTLGEWYGK